MGAPTPGTSPCFHGRGHPTTPRLTSSPGPARRPTLCGSSPRAASECRLRGTKAPRGAAGPPAAAGGGAPWRPALGTALGRPRSGSREQSDRRTGRGWRENGGRKGRGRVTASRRASVGGAAASAPRRAASAGTGASGPPRSLVQGPELRLTPHGALPRGRRARATSGPRIRP